MTAKEFLESKGFDDLREGLYHVFEQDEIELLLNEFAALPCSCETTNYTYGWAKCIDCGRLKDMGNGVAGLLSAEGDFVDDDVMHWTVSCPNCGTDYERFGYFDIGVTDKCAKCGTEFQTTRVYFNDGNYIE